LTFALASLVQVEKGELLIRFLLHSHILNAKQPLRWHLASRQASSLAFETEPNRN